MNSQETSNNALRLSVFFGNTADFWMNLQQRWDLYWAKMKESDELHRIQSIT